MLVERDPRARVARTAALSPGRRELRAAPAKPGPLVRAALRRRRELVRYSTPRTIADPTARVCAKLSRMALPGEPVSGVLCLA